MSEEYYIDMEAVLGGVLEAIGLIAASGADRKLCAECIVQCVAVADVVEAAFARGGATAESLAEVRAAGSSMAKTIISDMDHFLHGGVH